LIFTGEAGFSSKIYNKNFFEKISLNESIDNIEINIITIFDFEENAFKFFCDFITNTKKIKSFKLDICDIYSSPNENINEYLNKFFNSLIENSSIEKFKVVIYDDLTDQNTNIMGFYLPKVIELNKFIINFSFFEKCFMEKIDIKNLTIALYKNENIKSINFGTNNSNNKDDYILLINNTLKEIRIFSYSFGFNKINFENFCKNFKCK
jgi:hypothetical protein